MTTPGQACIAGFVRSRHTRESGYPVIKYTLKRLDSRLYGNDEYAQIRKQRLKDHAFAYAYL
jgi:hypothetical protein